MTILPILEKMHYSKVCEIICWWKRLSLLKEVQPAEFELSKPAPDNVGVNEVTLNIALLVLSELGRVIMREALRWQDVWRVNGS